MNYGNDFKQWRKSANLSQEQLAKLTGISQQAISFWEQNKRTPNMDDCITLANLYGITLDELVGREKIPNPKLEKEKYAKQITYQNSTHNGNNNF